MYIMEVGDLVEYVFKSRWQSNPEDGDTGIILSILEDTSNGNPNRFEVYTEGTINIDWVYRWRKIS